MSPPLLQGARPQEIRFAISVLVCSWACFSGILFIPLWVSASVEQFGISESFAGRVAAVQHSFVAIVSIGLIKFIAKWNSRRTFLFGLATLLVANVLPILIPDISTLIVSRALSGTGEGISLAVMHRLIAQHGKPDRLFGIMNFGVTLFAIVAYPLISPLIDTQGVNPVFLAAAGAAVVGVPFAWWMSAPASEGKEATPAPSAAAVRLGRTGLVALGALAIFYIGEGALWTYLVRIGLGTGAGMEAIGNTLSTALLFGLLGTIIIGWMGVRFGRAIPLIGSLVGLCVVALFMAHVSDAATFIKITYFFYFVFIFTVTYSSGLLAAIDPTGAVVSAAPGARSMGNVVGPIVASFAVLPGHYTYLGWTAFVFYAISMLLFLPLALKYRD